MHQARQPQRHSLMTPALLHEAARERVRQRCGEQEKNKIRKPRTIFGNS
jgi:hypothetical protein